MHRTRHYPFKSNTAPRQLIDEAILRNQQAVAGTVGPSTLTGGSVSRTNADDALYGVQGD
jgi:hypothetical protein